MKRSKEPRLIIVIAGSWWCNRCLASGFVPARVKHRDGCGRKRPIAWSPAPIVDERN